jgi:hypothetical protein
METERAKYIKMLQETNKMIENSMGEVNMIKITNPNKKVADEKHFVEVKDLINEQLIQNGVNVINESPTTPKKQQLPRVEMDEKEVVKETAVKKQTKKINNDEVKEILNKKVDVVGDGVIRREIPENERKMIEELQKHQKIKVTPSYEEFTPPKTNKKYDVIPIPSNGQCYPHKKGKIGVYYLTAMDENVILSPNLYRDGLMIDTLLKNRFTDETIDGDELIAADRDAIALWLRANGFGNEIDVTAVNPNTGREFGTTISLSQIKYKPFNLKGDENGEFDYKLLNGDEIKFTFPTRKEERRYDKFLRNIEKDFQRYKLTQIVEDLRSLVAGGFSELSTNDLDKIDTICNEIDLLKNKLSTENQIEFYSTAVTELEILLIREINGNRDRSYIREYVENMFIKDIRDFRKYVDENAPALDFNVEITIPDGEEGAGTKFTTLIGGFDQNIFVSSY